ncbi:MAG: hypothetical protein AWU57_2878 [Marinobacter sp. T13-3]|nr:MAG: hypothetical protein AWU57_2878 [Marinobacter sp. T13-3]
MSTSNDEAQVYLRRKEKNLSYFRVALPSLYNFLENMKLTKAELIVTPGLSDVDMTIEGKSVYRGLAKEYSENEACGFFDKNDSSKELFTFPPPWKNAYSRIRFSSKFLHDIVSNSPVNEINFGGYKIGKNLPSVVFLGCGLGFHIESVVNRRVPINAVIVEREPEKFALSLFTVDWESICRKFQKKGYSLNFAIGRASEYEEVRNLMSRHLMDNVPFYPFLTTYYNHFADVELAKTAVDVGKDLALISSNWSNYDDELMRLKNSIINDREGMTFIKHGNLEPHQKPLVVVGSGPSLDDRIDDLVRVRSKVTVISAGTSLRPLVAAGIIPDLHVELDPAYLIYELHSDIDEQVLSGITLIAVNELNPWVKDLFSEVYFYFKRDNSISQLAGVVNSAFPHCNPTCTNAALSIGHSLGFRQIYLFGTDYGYKDINKDHSDGSVYGANVESQNAKKLRENASNQRRSSFRVPAANGSDTVFTRNDYYTAKRYVESFYREISSAHPNSKFFNCSDGAEIEGIPWVTSQEFLDSLESRDESEGPDLKELLAVSAVKLPDGKLDHAMSDVVEELVREVGVFLKLLRRAPLQGRKDLCLLANEIRGTARTIKPHAGATACTPAQSYVSQLMTGTLMHFVLVGLTHGLACSDSELPHFLKHWREEFKAFLKAVPDHFSEVVTQTKPRESDSWALLNFSSADPRSGS